MYSPSKLLSLAVLAAGLSACGGGSDGGKKPTPTTSSSPGSSSTSSVIATSAAVSSGPVSSALASSSASSVGEGELAQAAVDYSTYSVAELDNCGMNISAADKTFALFADYDNAAQNQSLTALKFSGWNHTTNGNTAEWANLKHTPATYNFTATTQANESCNGVDTLDVVLVKKIADWDRQHANGFEREILAHGYTFGSIENLVVDVKINSAKTSVPSVDSLKTIYANYVSAGTVEALDEGKVNVDITLHDGANLHAKAIVQLDQTTYADRWVRVTIPMNKFSFYEEINYNRTAKTQADLNSVVIKRMLVVGETKKGTVLRGNINPWTSNVPETFKEMDLSFKKFEFQLK